MLIKKILLLKYTAIVLILPITMFASVALAGDKGVTLDPKEIDPISVVDDGVTKTVRFFFESSTFSTGTELPLGVNEPIKFQDFRNSGESINFLGRFKTDSRFRLNVEFVDEATCPFDITGGSDFAQVRIQGVFIMANEFGSFTFWSEADTWCPPTEPLPDLLWPGESTGIWKCVDEALIEITLSDNVLVPTLGIAGFLTHSFVSPLDPQPDVNKIVIELTGPSDCPI